MPDIWIEKSAEKIANLLQERFVSFKQPVGENEIAAIIAKHMPGWISTKERLPEVRKPVLVYYENDFHGMGIRCFAMAEYDFVEEAWYEKAYANSDDFSWDLGPKEKVLFWITLPEMPARRPCHER